MTGTRAVPLALTAILALAGPAAADEVKIASWGGIVTTANRNAYWDPFEKATGIKVIDDTFNGEIAKVRAQIEAQSYQWDIAEMEDAEAVAGCEEGLYEKLDKSRLPIADLLPGTYSDCGLVSVTTGVGLAFNKAKIPDGPQSWADFFDVEKFPGKRGMRKTASLTLEVALLAAGVPKEDVYKTLATKEGQDLAFNTLDRIRDHVVWWSSGTEQVQGLISGEYEMTIAYNGRIAAANKTQNQDISFVWSAGYLTSNNHWVILKGAPNARQAMDFIAWAATPEPQAEFMRQMDGGSANGKAFALLSSEQLAYMPNTPERLPYSLNPDLDVWRDNLDALTERFNAWASQ